MGRVSTAFRVNLHLPDATEFSGTYFDHKCKAAIHRPSDFFIIYNQTNGTGLETLYSLQFKLTVIYIQLAKTDL